MLLIIIFLIQSFHPFNHFYVAPSSKVCSNLTLILINLQDIGFSWIFWNTFSLNYQIEVFVQLVSVHYDNLTFIIRFASTAAILIQIIRPSSFILSNFSKNQEYDAIKIKVAFSFTFVNLFSCMLDSSFSVSCSEPNHHFTKNSLSL